MIERRTRSPHGFTLIELIVVVSIISVLALGLGLSTTPVVERNRPGSATHEAAALAGAVEAARERAFHQRRPAGLVPQTRGWAIVARAPEGEGWVPPGWGGPRHEGQFAGAVEWQINGAPHFPGTIAPDPDAAPPILFLPDGRATAFRVTLTGQRGAAQICATDGLEPLTCRPR
ncbi:MAG: GspH/FimT family pseudopilin [Pararhodobacter sp.]|nr:GspH/FimT family pseudopilin [Pararhodobacter sp.]